MIYIKKYKKAIGIVMSLLFMSFLMISCNKQVSNNSKESEKSEKSSVISGSQKSDDFQSEEFFSNFINIYIQLSNNKELDYSYLNTFVSENSDVYKSIKAYIEESRKKELKSDLSDISVEADKQNKLEVEVKIKISIEDKQKNRKSNEKEIHFTIGKVGTSYKITKIDGDLSLIN